jgi:hypothetical protein
MERTGLALAVSAKVEDRVWYSTIRVVLAVLVVPGAFEV